MSDPDVSARGSSARASFSAVSKPVRWHLIGAILLSGVGGALLMVPLACIAQIGGIVLVDGSVGPGLGRANGEVLRAAAVGIGGLGLGVLLMACGDFTAHLADVRLTRHLRLSVLRRLAGVPLGWFTDRASGDVKQVMLDDVGTLHELTAHFYTAVGRSVGVILASVAYMFSCDWRMAIASLLPFLCFYLLFRAMKKALDEENLAEFVARQAHINRAVVEFVNGISIVKAFGDGRRAFGAYREAVDAFMKAFLAFTAPLVVPLANANAAIAPVTVLGAVLAFGTLFVSRGWMAPVDVLPFVLVAPAISAPLTALSFVMHGVASGTAAAERVQALLGTPLLPPARPEAVRVPVGTEVRFEDVGYAYGPQNEVLSSIRLTLRPGTVTALVGASGAGKTTLARLLLRFFDPTEGRITLGGVDLRQIEAQQLYRNVGFVLQDVRLIHASLRENIALGRPSADQSEIEAAARAANIHERIMTLPRGYASVIGEDAELSGGEEQRVSIARAVLLDAPIVVLDEATASVDAENELAIQDALSRLAKGRTLVVITHRLDAVRRADNIVVIEQGTVCEQGTHRELLDRRGAYARLWSASGHAAGEDRSSAPC